MHEGEQGLSDQELGLIFKVTSKDRVEVNELQVSGQHCPICMTEDISRGDRRMIAVLTKKQRTYSSEFDRFSVRTRVADRRHMGRGGCWPGGRKWRTTLVTDCGRSRAGKVVVARRSPGLGIDGRIDEESWLRQMGPKVSLLALRHTRFQNRTSDRCRSALRSAALTRPSSPLFPALGRQYT